MRPFKYSIVAVAAGLLLFGCSSGSDGGGSSSADQAAPEAGEVEPGEAGPGEAEPGQVEDDATGPAGDPQADTGGRAVIYEASLEVEDAEPEAVAEEAWELAESFGGFVTSDERDRAIGDEEHFSSAYLVLRVPSEHFAEAMDGLTALGERERHRSVSTEDVTEATVDLAAHIATKTASVERVRGLLAEATSVSAILELESELAQREGELASLQSQLNDLEDRVALSTIEFTVVAPAVREAPKQDEGYGGPENFWDGLVVGFKGAVGVLVAVSVVLGVILPFLPVVALVLAAVFVPIRLARKRRAANGAVPSQQVAHAAPRSAPPAPVSPPRQ